MAHEHPGRVVHLLKHQLVWCPKNRRSVLERPIVIRLQELVGEIARLRRRLPALWARSSFRATVVAPSATMIERYSAAQQGV